MSELAVGSLKGLAANDFVIDVAAGSKVVQPGAILQVVQTVKTDPFASSSATFTTVTGMTASITPSSASSKILILTQVTHSLGANAGYGHFKVTRGGTDIYIGDASSSRIQAVFGGTSVGEGGRILDAQGQAISGSIMFLDSPATTSSVTYQLEVRTASNGSVAVNRSIRNTDNATAVAGASTITLMEVAG